MYQQIEFQCFEKKKKFISSIQFTLLGCLLLFFLTTNISFAADKQLFNMEDVVNFSPRANRDFVTVLVDNQQLLDEAGINTRLHIAHFFAQIATETGGMRRLDENLNYPKEVLLKVFSRKTISIEKANQIARKPIEIANWVYGDRLGNLGKNTNDGWIFRGSGFIQLTGRKNFKDRGNEVKLPFESNPDLVRQPLEGLKAASSYWKTRKINNAVAENNIHKIRIMVNGPKAHGLSQAKIWFSRASKVFGLNGGGSQEDMILAEAAKESKSLSATAEALHELGFLTQQESSEGNEQAVINGLHAYQKSRGLKETGVLDEDTLYSITDPQEWRHDQEEEETQQESPIPQGNPEGSYIFDVEKGTETIGNVNNDFSAKENTISKGTGVVNPRNEFNLTPQEVSVIGNTITAYAP